MNKVIEKIKKIPFFVIPIIIAMAFIPLIVHYYPFESQLKVMSWYSPTSQTGDMFNFYKAEALTSLAYFMIMLTFVGLVFSKKLSWHKALIPLILYAVMAIISTWLSDYQYFSLNGIDHHFESVYVLLAYCTLVFFCFWFADSEHAVKFIFYGWFIGIAVMGVIGLFQLARHDLFGTDFGEFFILPEELRAGKDVTFTFEPGRVYLTLYNPNYVGFYGALVVPILMVFFIFTKNKFVKIISIILNSVVFLCLLGSGARNGMIALFMALFVMLIFFRKKLKKHWISFLIAYASLGVIFAAFNMGNSGMVTERLEAGFDIDADNYSSLERIETNDDNVVITYGENKLTCTLDYNMNDGTATVHMLDEDGEEVEREDVKADVPTFKITDERFPFEVSIGKVGGHVGFVVDIEGKKWPFSNQTGYEGYYFYSPYGKYTKIEEAESAIFTNYSHLFSGRGYLWARTIPLLKDYIFVGSGPDTFTIVFPQKDYVAASELGYDKMTVTKPHNLYLQIGTQTGMISLLAFLVFNLIYLIECIKIYFKGTADNFMGYLGVAIMISVIGYLISGIINDSTVTTAPIYWCLMGIGLAVNRLNKKSKEEKSK